MKVKEVTLGMSYTWQPAQYHAARGEASMTVELGDEDTLEDATAMIQANLPVMVAANLADVDLVHDKLYKKGVDPKDLLEEMVGGTEEEDGDFDDDLFSVDD